MASHCPEEMETMEWCSEWSPNACDNLSSMLNSEQELLDVLSNDGLDKSGFGESKHYTTTKPVITDIKKKGLLPLSTDGSYFFLGKDRYLEEMQNEYMCSHPYLDHFKKSSAIGYIARELVLFLSSKLKNTENELELPVLLRSIRCLSKNHAISAEYLGIFTSALVTFLINSSSKSNIGSHKYLLKDIAADILSELNVKKVLTPKLQKCVLELSSVFRNRKCPLDLQYGTVVASISLGIEAITEVILPHLDAYCSHAVFEIATNSPSRQETSIVWDKLILACEDVMKLACVKKNLLLYDRKRRELTHERVFRILDNCKTIGEFYNRFRDEQTLRFSASLIKCQQMFSKKFMFAHVLLDEQKLREMLISHIICEKIQSASQNDETVDEEQALSPWSSDKEY